MMNRLNLLAFIFFLPLHFFAQQAITADEAAKEFVGVNAAYAGNSKLKISMSYALYPSYASTTAFENEKGVYMRQNGSTYSDMLGIKTLNTGKVAVTVDDADQMIVVSDPPKNKQKDPAFVEIDSLLTRCSSIEKEVYDNGTIMYRLNFGDEVISEYNCVDVFVNAQHMFTKIRLFFRDATDLDETDNDHTRDRPRLEISYEETDTTPVFTAGQFSESNFINISGKNITCTPTYSSYRLINNKLS